MPQPDPRRDVPLVGEPPPSKPAPLHPLSLPPGWTVAFDNFIRPGPRVRDFRARNQDMVGRCESRACMRKVRIDARELMEIGLADVAMDRLAVQWRCHRLQGCQMALKGGMMNHDLRLVSVTRRPNVRIRFRCGYGPCTFYRDVPAAEVAAAIQPRVSYDPLNAVVAGVGKLWREPCQACGRTAWSSLARVIDEGSSDWKRDGEGTWEKVAWRG